MNPLEIIMDEPGYLPELVAFNRRWIQMYFELEGVDETFARDPGAVLKKGGHTLTALRAGEVVGVAALLPRADPDELELAKMAVAPDYQGQGIGRALAKRGIAEARRLGARRLVLYTNTCLKPAMALYHSLGFENVEASGCTGDYSRCNASMALSLQEV